MLFITNLSTGFQDPASPIMEGIIDLHNYIFFYLIVVFIFVFVIFANTLFTYLYRFQIPTTTLDLFLRFDLVTLRFNEIFLTCILVPYPI